MITIKDIEAAEERARDYFYQTPFLRSSILSDRFGAHIHLKLENMQRTGSFKIRGAANMLLQRLSEKGNKLKQNGVVAASAGNHAQGVACIAQSLSIPATIVMPETTPLIKIQNTKSYGAKVVLHGMRFDDAYTHAQELCKKDQATFVHPFDDPLIMAGQGIVGLEMARSVGDADLDVVCVPIGGGGLMAGVATAIRKKYPKCKIIGIQTEQVPHVGQKVLNPKAKPPKTTGTTMAEGIAVKYPAQRVVEYLHTLVDDVVFVSEEEIAGAILFLLEKVKTVTEGAGASSIAALLSEKIKLKKNQNAAFVICGGNVDVQLLGNIIGHGLSMAGRICGLRIQAPDQPGALLKLCSLIAGERANIQQVFHHRDNPKIHFGHVEIEMHLETKGSEHRDKVCALLKEQGYAFERLF